MVLYDPWRFSTGEQTIYSCPFNMLAVLALGSPKENDYTEIGSGEMGSGEIGSGDMGSGEFGSGEMGSGEKGWHSNLLNPIQEDLFVFIIRYKGELTACPLPLISQLL